jgi:hypothetical protein
MFYANFKPKSWSLLDFLLLFDLNSVTFNTEKAGNLPGPPAQSLFDFLTKTQPVNRQLRFGL